MRTSVDFITATSPASGARAAHARGRGRRRARGAARAERAAILGDAVEPERSARFCTVDGAARPSPRRSRPAPRPGSDLAARSSTTGRLAGTIAPRTSTRGIFPNANVGYWVDLRARTGRRARDAAVAAVVDEAFGSFGLHRLAAGTLVDNVGSQRVLEKNALPPDSGSRGALSRAVAGAWRDHVALPAHPWKAVASQAAADVSSGTTRADARRRSAAALRAVARASSTSSSKSAMSSPSSGCQSTPSAKRFAGSSSASTVPSSAQATSPQARRRCRP